MDEAARKNSNTLLIISYIFIVIFPIVSLILALVKKADCSQDEVLASHVSNQLRILLWAFVWGIICFVLGIILGIMIPFIGSMISLLFYGIIFLWVLYRAITGAVKLSSNQPV